MASRFESGALLGHVYRLGDLYIRLRLARTSDVTAIRELLATAGHDAPELAAARLVHFDPCRRYVVCATGLIDARETLLGLGSIELDGGQSTEPELLVVAHEETRRLLRSLLVNAAQAAVRAA